MLYDLELSEGVFSCSVVTIKAIKMLNKMSLRDAKFLQNDINSGLMVVVGTDDDTIDSLTIQDALELLDKDGVSCKVSKTSLNVKVKSIKRDINEIIQLHLDSNNYQEAVEFIQVMEVFQEKAKKYL
jgi:hypothetical protein